MMKRTIIQLPEDQLKALRKLAKTRKVSVAKLIRESVALYVAAPQADSVEEKRKRAIAAVGFIKSDPGNATDLSTKHDRYLEKAFGQ
jgi:hypothetical protein